MLNRIYRITKDKEYQTIYRRGRFQSTALFSIHYLPSKKGISRVGIVVSKKITKKAVERNLLKRRVREISKDLHPKLNNAYDIVISVKPAAKDVPFAEFQKTLIEMFSKGNLI